jgi:hypothetical protein
MTAPSRPRGVSKTGNVEPSPKPQTSRSIAVGISLRCLPNSPPSGEKNSTEQYNVPESLSMTPTTICVAVARATSPMASQAAPGTSTALSK